MALFSADQLRSIDPGEAPRQGASRPHAALLDKLTAEAARPAYSRVVVVGAVRGIEFGMLLLTGLALFHLHVVDDAPKWPIYYLTSVGISMLAILVFQTLQSYTVPTFRRPVRQLFRMAGGWCAIFFIAFAAMFFLKADGAVFQGLDRQLACSGIHRTGGRAHVSGASRGRAGPNRASRATHRDRRRRRNGRRPAARHRNGRSG